MIFAGLVPCSFLDYPGQLAAVVFTRGCNLRCRYCHNPDLVCGAGLDSGARISEAEVLELLASRRGRLDGLVVTGGEPTLQPDLAPFLAEVKARGFRVKLDTNGTRPSVVRSLLGARLLDFLAIDLKAAPAQAAWLCGDAEQPESARRCLELALAAGVAHEVRTTVVTPTHDAAHLASLARYVEGAQRWALQPFRPGRQLDPFSNFGIPGEALLEAARAASHASVVVRGRALSAPRAQTSERQGPPPPHARSSEPRIFPTGAGHHRAAPPR